MERNRLVSKLAYGIWQILTWVFSLLVFTWMGFFWAKYVSFELKNYRGVIFHDIKERCKIWRKTDLLLGKWHEEFCKFSREHSRMYLFELKKYGWVIFNEIEEWCKIWRKNDLLLGKWQEFYKFSPEHWKVSKLELW